MDSSNRFIIKVSLATGIIFFCLFSRPGFADSIGEDFDKWAKSSKSIVTAFKKDSFVLRMKYEFDKSLLTAEDKTSLGES